MDVDKNNVPPKSPPTLPERPQEQSDVIVKYVRGKKKAKDVAPANFLAGEPEYLKKLCNIK
jgi:hypothetical protein